MQPDAPRPDRLDDLLDQLVAEFADQLNAGRDPSEAEFLERVPEEHRAALGRCLRMLRAGIASAPSRARPLGPGVVLDGYRIDRELGRGGMSTVWLAEELELRRPVALKVLRPGLAVDGRHVDRFKREALAVARLQHPHIVQIHAVGEADGYHYIAMEHVDGGNLAEVIARLPRDRDWTAADLAEATGLALLAEPGRSYDAALAAFLTPVVRALAVAHELGLVHRDIKPSNILIHKDGRAKIADFGLAKASEDPALSMTGEPLGTPYYMSPEQAEMKNHSVDERSDVYSFGVTLYECLSGSRPFEGESALAVLEKIRRDAPSPLRARAPKRSHAAEAVVLRAMARRKEDRYPTAIDLASDLAALAEGRATLAQTYRGSVWQRVWGGFRQVCRGEGFEYVSPRRFLGFPLVHVNYRLRNSRMQMRVAKGWLAMSDVPIGGIALGPVAIGLFAIGGVAVGLGAAMAGVAVGGYAFGGLTGGVCATGGTAFGYLAAGGLAVGRYAVGGGGYSAVETVLRDEFGQAYLSPQAAEVFDRWMPWVSMLLER